MGRGVLAGWAAATLAALPSAGSGQADSAEDRRLADPASLEEIVVYGDIPLIQLRTEVYRAEDDYFAKFNALNSTDEFDIRCRRTATTGSRMLHRVCRARFYSDLEARAAMEWLRGNAVNPQQWLASYTPIIERKAQLLQEEMKTLLGQHPELLDALLEFDAAKGRFEAEQARRCAGRLLVCRR